MSVTVILFRQVMKQRRQEDLVPSVANVICAHRSPKRHVSVLFTFEFIRWLECQSSPLTPASRINLLSHLAGGRGETLRGAPEPGRWHREARRDFAFASFRSPITSSRVFYAFQARGHRVTMETVRLLVFLCLETQPQNQLFWLLRSMSIVDVVLSRKHQVDLWIRLRRQNVRLTLWIAEWKVIDPEYQRSKDHALDVVFFGNAVVGTAIRHNELDSPRRGEHAGQVSMRLLESIIFKSRLIGIEEEAFEMSARSPWSSGVRAFRTSRFF